MNKRNGLNVFAGPRAVIDYTDPGKHAPTSLVELPSPSELNPFSEEKVRIFVKVLGELPLNTGKLIPVSEWFNRHEKKITRETIVDINSSGGAGLAAVVKGMAMKAKQVNVYMPEDTPPEKQQLIKRAGGNLVLTREERGKPTGVEQVRRLARLPHHLVFDQYGDYANVDGHMKVTMAQVWEQLRSIGTFPGAVVAAKGTTGTLVAAREFAAKHSPQTICVGIECTEGEPIPAVRPESRLRPSQIKFDHNAGTCREDVKRYPAYRMTLLLFKQAGLKVGLSTGAAVWGSHCFLHEYLPRPSMQKARDRKGYLNVVVVSLDILDPYLDQLRVILDAGDL